MEGHEEYLGGFASGYLTRGLMSGYGLYATNRRIIGVKSRKAGAGALLGAAVGGAVGFAIGTKLSEDEGAKMIHELDAKKDFSVGKDDISRIELKKPGWARPGQIIFFSKSGDLIKVRVGHKKDYERLNELMQKFYPQVLVLV